VTSLLKAPALATLLAVGLGQAPAATPSSLPTEASLSANPAQLRDWADRLREGRSIIPAPLFPDQAEFALKLFKTLRVVDAPGSPTLSNTGCA